MAYDTRKAGLTTINTDLDSERKDFARNWHEGFMTEFAPKTQKVSFLLKPVSRDEPYTRNFRVSLSKNDPKYYFIRPYGQYIYELSSFRDVNLASMIEEKIGLETIPKGIPVRFQEKDIKFGTVDPFTFKDTLKLYDSSYYGLMVPEFEDSGSLNDLDEAFLQEVSFVQFLIGNHDAVLRNLKVSSEGKVIVFDNDQILYPLSKRRNQAFRDIGQVAPEELTPNQKEILLQLDFSFITKNWGAHMTDLEKNVMLFNRNVMLLHDCLNKAEKIVQQDET